VHPLFPGIAQMAIAAAERTDKPVYVVPIVWKLKYDGDVSGALVKELQFIEDALHVRRTHGDVREQFWSLQEEVLAMRMHRFGYKPIGDGDFFARQETFQRYLLESLSARYDVGESDQVDRRIGRMTRTMRARMRELGGADTPSAVAERAQLKQDHEMVEEAKRLGEFSRVVYGHGALTQEEIGESLKRMRDRLVNFTKRQKIANMLPRPFGSRVAYIGVPEPIRVSRCEPDERLSYERALLDLMRASMQQKLDEINALR
jgi:hypothetical protein